MKTIIFPLLDSVYKFWGYAQPVGQLTLMASASLIGICPLTSGSMPRDSTRTIGAFSGSNPCIVAIFDYSQVVGAIRNKMDLFAFSPYYQQLRTCKRSFLSIIRVFLIPSFFRIVVYLVHGITKPEVRIIIVLEITQRGLKGEKI